MSTFSDTFEKKQLTGEETGDIFKENEIVLISPPSPRTPSTSPPLYNSPSPRTPSTSPPGFNFDRNIDYIISGNSIFTQSFTDIK